VALRSAARTFHASDPAQCAAILGPRAAASPARSAAALAAISPALAGLLDAPTVPRAVTAGDRSALQQVSETVSQSPPSAQPDAPDDDPKVHCDRLLLLYDAAVAQSPGAGAAVVRGLLGH